MKNQTRTSTLIIFALLVGLAAVLLVSVVPVKASQDSSGFPSITIESYTYQGQTTYYSSGSIPVGAVIDFRVWVDLYNNDPVHIGYGDGASDSYSFNGAFSHDFYHAYQTAGRYIAVADMPTDSGTFDGGAGVQIGGGGGNSGGNGGGSGGFDFANFDFPSVITVLGAMIGIIAVVVALVPAGSGAAPIPTLVNPSDTDAVVIGGSSTPQLLRSPEAEKQEAAQAHTKQCANLKAVYDDARKQAEFTRGMEEQCARLLAASLQKLPIEYLKEYVKDKIKEAATEIPIDVMMTIIGAEELEVLAKLCKYAAEELVAEKDPGAVAQLYQNYQSYSQARTEAKRLADLAAFRLNEFKSQCPDWTN